MGFYLTTPLKGKKIIFITLSSKEFYFIFYLKTLQYHKMELMLWFIHKNTKYGFFKEKKDKQELFKILSALFNRNWLDTFVTFHFEAFFVCPLTLSKFLARKSCVLCHQQQLHIVQAIHLFRTFFFFFSNKCNIYWKVKEFNIYFIEIKKIKNYGIIFVGFIILWT